jgi:ribosomal protein S18 acetylase RimI-like enzyme
MTLELEYQVIEVAPVEEIVDLYKAGGWWQETPENRARIAPMIAGSFCFMAARLPDGKMIGMGRAISDGASDAYIQDVVILPQYRGHGIGAEIIRRLTAYCQQHAIEWIGLIAEPGTTGFYERLGFAPMIGFQPMLHRKRG